MDALILFLFSVSLLSIYAFLHTLYLIAKDKKQRERWKVRAWIVLFVFLTSGACAYFLIQLRFS